MSIVLRRFNVRKASEHTHVIKKFNYISIASPNPPAVSKIKLEADDEAEARSQDLRPRLLITIRIIN